MPSDRPPPLPITCVRSFAIGAVALAVWAATPRAQSPQQPYPFVIEETTIARLHEALAARTVTCRDLVDHYLARIAAFDRQAAVLNSIVVVNPDAVRQASQLDQKFVRDGLTGPLHCVPVVVKDNIETAELDTTAGSLSLKGYRPAKDATVVAKLKAAGAIVLAKSNMAEFGLNPLQTVNSLQGPTRNPYALDRVPAGSSGGTAVAVAANLALVGLGTDTGSSIRGPAAHNSIVGIRTTMGHTSRAGMIPLNYLSDVIGPMARTVEDAATVLQVMAGWDGEDPMTDFGKERPVPPYARSLVAEGLRGAKLGVLRQAFQGGPIAMDTEIARVFARALEDLNRLGAGVIDEVNVEQVPSTPGADRCRGLKYDLNDYLQRQGGRVPVHSLAEIIQSGRFHESVRDELEEMQNAVQQGPGSEACKANAAYRQAFAAAVTREMDRLGLDALVYPTWSQPPQLAASVAPQQAGQTLMFATAAGFPAITVPMGFAREVLPAGLSFFGRAWSERVLIRLAYAYEQGTRHRRPPAGAPVIH